MNESIELTSQSCVLRGEDTAVFFKRAQLTVKIAVLNGSRSMDSTLVLNISTSGTEGVLTLVKTNISSLAFSSKISISSVKAIKILAGSTVIIRTMIIITLKVIIFGVELGIVTTNRS